MTIFDEYVDEVLRSNQQLVSQRLTVEKELFHQDIIRLMRDFAIMKNLVFMGGTCLRLCYGSERLSEDLNFSTEKEITPEEAERLSSILIEGLSEKYNLPVAVKKPEKDTDTETWKISIITNPGHSHITSQQIHIDICHYKSYLTELRMVRNAYSSGNNVAPLFIEVEKIEEILVDKLIAFAYRNRIKNRDLWDIYSLYCKNVKLNTEVLTAKLSDKGHDTNDYVSKYKSRMNEIKDHFPTDFHAELSRFLSTKTYEDSVLSKPEGPLAFSTILSDYLSV